MKRWQINIGLYGIIVTIIFVIIGLILGKDLGLNAMLTILFTIFSVGLLFFWVWTLVDCITKETNDGSNKLAWLLVIIFTNGIGALIYYFVRRPQRIKELGR